MNMEPLEVKSPIDGLARFVQLWLQVAGLCIHHFHIPNSVFLCVEEAISEKVSNQFHESCISKHKYQKDDETNINAIAKICFIRGKCTD